MNYIQPHRIEKSQKSTKKNTELITRQENRQKMGRINKTDRINSYQKKISAVKQLSLKPAFKYSW